jgi:hypothetical protein
LRETSPLNTEPVLTLKDAPRTARTSGSRSSKTRPFHDIGSAGQSASERTGRCGGASGALRRCGQNQRPTGACHFEEWVTAPRKS